VLCNASIAFDDSHPLALAFDVVLGTEHIRAHLRLRRGIVAVPLHHDVGCGVDVAIKNHGELISLKLEPLRVGRVTALWKSPERSITITHTTRICVGLSNTGAG
jgi:hypothetical protein